MCMGLLFRQRHLSEEWTVFCFPYSTQHSAEWVSVTAFICVRAYTAVGHFLERGLLMPVLPPSDSQQWASFYISSYHLNGLFCCVRLLCIVLHFCSLFLCSYAADMCNPGIWPHVTPLCLSIHAGQHRTAERWKRNTSDLQVPASSLSSWSLCATNHRCVILRHVFLISSHLGALTSVCLSGAVNYSDLLLVCSFLSASAWFSFSVGVPVMPSRGNPQTLNVSFPCLPKLMRWAAFKLYRSDCSSVLIATLVCLWIKEIAASCHGALIVALCLIFWRWCFVFNRGPHGRCLSWVFYLQYNRSA